MWHKTQGHPEASLQDPDLTFDKALKVALAADRDAQRLTVPTTTDKDLFTQKQEPPSAHVTPVHKVQPQRGKPQHYGERQQGTSIDCYRCGGKHNPSTCPCRQLVCHFCKKKGHLAKVCRKKAKSGSKSEEAKYVGVQCGEPEGEYMFQVQARTGSTSPFHTTITVNGRPLVMEVDTGASVSLISETTFNTIQKGLATLELKETTTRLQTYTGETIAVRGSTVIQVEHFDQTLKLPLTISAGDGPSLLGRDWLSALRLDWKSIFLVRNSPTLQDVLDKHGEVFKEGLGKLKGVAAKIYVDKDAQPKFHKANRVPFATREKVEKELQRLL